MNRPVNSTWLHRFAWLTAALTLLLPVTTGAIVTTLKAGMIFSDWPSSDGYNMLAYPWLSSARDEFVEHGHRLSGMTIGLLCLCLIIAAFLLDRRFPTRILAVGIFLAVLTQGLLGGARVLFDEQLLALIHGDFAALVFSLMSLMVLVTGQGWESRIRFPSNHDGRHVLVAAYGLLGTLVMQYVMGGILRHLRERDGLGWAWMVHPWFAIVVIMATVWFAVRAFQTNSLELRRCAIALIGLTVAQSLIGLGAWYVRYGIPSWGVVAQQDSLQQVIVCSLHKVVGMLTLMTGVLSVFCTRSAAPGPEQNHVSLTVPSTIAGAMT